MTHRPTFQLLLAIYLTAVYFTVITEAVECYECMWIKGRTDDDCWNMPEQRRSGRTSYLVDCSTYADEHGNYTSCETAIGCLDRGFGKRPSLHRACSLGDTENRDVGLLADESIQGSENITTNDSMATTSVTPTPAHERRRRQVTVNESQSDSTEAAQGTNESERSSSHQDCYSLGDGETADGTVITNLIVCYCKENECNVHADDSVHASQKRVADNVCNYGSNMNIFASIRTAIVAPFLVQFPIILSRLT